MSAFVWVDGSLVEAEDARVPYDDHGITVGDGIFETIKLTPEGPFALTRHLDRFRRSAAVMRIPVPADDELRAAIDAVVETHRADGFLRLTLTAGPGPLGSNRDELTPRLLVAVRPGVVKIDPTEVLIGEWTRNERGALAGVKSTSYGENVVALAAAHEVGASEALFANTVGQLCEGTGSNVFVGFGDRLLTPPLHSGCLDGITRQLLLEAGVGVEEDIPMESLGEATEAFLVSTAREVQPISSWNGTALPECPGPLTQHARTVWVEKIVDRLDP